MHNIWLRRTTLALNVFVAITAIGGGTALATGAEADRFPTGWLARTPWSSYLIPGLILAVGVGGTAALAAAACLRRLPSAGLATAGAGVVLAGQVSGEIVLLAQPDAPTPTEVFYLAVAAAMLLTGAVLARRAHRADTQTGS